VARPVGNGGMPDPYTRGNDIRVGYLSLPRIHGSPSVGNCDGWLCFGWLVLYFDDSVQAVVQDRHHRAPFLPSSLVTHLRDVWFDLERAATSQSQSAYLLLVCDLFHLDLFLENVMSTPSSGRVQSVRGVAKHPRTREQEPRTAFHSAIVCV
jgi:hypothetical protein